MAYGKKTENKPLGQLKADLDAGAPKTLYVFWGDESYLKEYYLAQLTKLVGSEGFGDFNIVELSGGSLSYDGLMDAVESAPFGGERKLVIVRDYNLMRPSGQLKDVLPELLASLPEYLCLVFYYDALEWKPDKRTSLYKTVDKYAQIIEFERADNADLIPWVKRNFAAFHKTIETKECEYLLFLCGGLMTNLKTEIAKIAAGTRQSKITQADIDALASRTLDAEIFAMTDCVMKADFSRALLLLRDLFACKNEPIVVHSAITRQMQRLYAARLALKTGKGEDYLMKLLGLRSSYPARLLLQAARGMNLAALRKIQKLCCDADLELKSSVPDYERTVELLLLKIATEVKES